ncbi:hypothetical protein U9M48_010380 [Paspalum notatum var. saurae]|uniref:CRAL-TRIO domain-containing protein n=1 Tax=Paspalum notatum var. saurae TaxID=547442 RepID=A0AAQ3STA5_PASNO
MLSYKQINELKSAVGPLSARGEKYCSDTCLTRYLEARNWNVTKSRKMLEESLKWRAAYRPEDIRWNTTSHDGQVRFLVYVLENAILNLTEGQDKMVWLIDFTGWTMAHATPIKTARECTSILQNHYPERLGIAFLYNPPKVFEAFYKAVKYFLDPRSIEKLNFVYQKDEESMQALYKCIDPEVLPVEFGGKNNVVYNHEEYSKSMLQDDIKTSRFWEDDAKIVNHAINGTFVPDVAPQSSLIAAKARIPKPGETHPGHTSCNWVLPVLRSFEQHSDFRVKETMFRRKHALDFNSNDAEQREAKVTELKAALGPLSARGDKYCSEACLKRYLEARNWNVAKSKRMLEESLKWRASYRPEDIRWPDVSVEAETGQIRFLVYTLENAIFSLPEGQEKMVWLIDFTGWTVAHASPTKTSRETANILQNHYPERLAIGFLFNPPKVFEAFYKVIKIFLDPKSIEKVNFVYQKDEESMKVMYKYIDPEVLPVEFGGKNNVVYDHEEYSELMMQDDIKTTNFWAVDVKTDHTNPSINGTLVPDVSPQPSLLAAKAS